MVEPAGPPLDARLERRRRAFASGPTGGRQRRARPEGDLLLRTLPAGTQRDVAALRGRPPGQRDHNTIPLSWCSEKLLAAGKRVLALVWDNASWHKSREVRRWISEHNREVKKGEKEGVRIVGCLLPKQSPWLNPIEPK